ncbi:hypothetical protein BURK1_00314 [Burkholderiales bacterium]|nr:hypothetical protein BURK1_00314 [Burkholderiales bacterium]
MRSARQAAAWAAWSLALNLLWEVAQLPYYSFAPDLGTAGIAWAVVHCTAGDVAIALASFGAGTLATGDLEWPVRRSALGLAVALGAGLAWTVPSEWLNVHVRGAWAYAPSMPTLAGIGVLPILQWIVLPPLVLLAVRRGETAARRHDARSD